MDFPEAQAYLYSLKHHGTKYGIDRMRFLAEKLNHPEQQFPIIHVAGTNGKGAVCAMLDSIYRQAGYRTGLFTSPHLVHLTERIKVDGQPIDEATIASFVTSLKPIADAIAAVDPDDHPSFFEFMTAIGFLFFVDEKIDIALVETGLGGKLDSTNIVNPLVSVITSISRDHTEILGDSLQLIAQAKAGIIKKDKPVVIGPLRPEVESLIRSVAKEKHSPVYSVIEEFGDDWHTYPQTSLKGSFQRKNAATACLACHLIQDHFPVTEEEIRIGLRNVFWPARFQEISISQERTLILDTTHNEEGTVAFAENLENLKRKPIILVGTLGESRAKVLMPVIARFAGEIALLVPNHPRAASFKVLENALPSTYKGKVSRCNIEHLFPSPGTCTLGSPQDIIVATGSIYLMGEICKQFFSASDLKL